MIRFIRSLIWYKKVKAKDFINWIIAQDDNRPLNMSASSNLDKDATYGCLMVEYAKDVLRISKNHYIECGYKDWQEYEREKPEYYNKQPKARFEEGVTITNILGTHYIPMFKTFGEVKKHLNSRAWGSFFG